MRTTFLSRVLNILLMAMAFVPFMPPMADAGIAVTPTIVMIEGRNRYGDITVVNTGTDMTSYEMGWRFTRMVEGEGRYVNSDVSTTEFDVSKHLIFTPRRVTLGPSSAQKIRIALRLDGEAPPPGDYRAHFFVRELPGNAAIPSAPADKRQATIGVNINFGLTVPVIYRVGEPNDTAKIGTVSVSRDPDTGQIKLKVPVTKSPSGYSMLGRVGAYLVKDGKEKPIGGVANANIFPEINSRTFDVVLKVPSLDSGTLKVVYQDRDDRDRTYDEKLIPIK